LLWEIQIDFGFTFLVLAHPGSPGQNTESRKMIVVVVLVVVVGAAAAAGCSSSSSSSSVTFLPYLTAL